MDKMIYIKSHRRFPYKVGDSVRVKFKNWEGKYTNEVVVGTITNLTKHLFVLTRSGKYKEAFRIQDYSLGVIDVIAV